MELNIINRLQLVGVLPSEGDFLTLTVKKDILQKINLTQEEIEEWEVKPKENGRIEWNTKKAKEIDVVFSAPEGELIKSALVKLNNEKKLNDQTYGLYDMFITTPKL